MTSLSNGDTTSIECELTQEILQGRSKDPAQSSSTKKMKHATILNEFMVMLSVCHTVIPEKVDGNIIYHAASPDERALVDGAKSFGYVFDTRTPNSVEIMALGDREKYEVLHVIEFTSARKRMSVIVRTPSGQIKIYCKGADSVIYERLITKTPEEEAQTRRPTTDVEDFRETTLQHLELFASEGLRTLCFATAEIPENRYNVSFFPCFRFIDWLFLENWIDFIFGAERCVEFFSNFIYFSCDLQFTIN